MDEWIPHPVIVEFFDYNTESWVREVISKGMKRHQNAKYFNCARIGHLKGIIGRLFLEFLLGMTQIESSKLLYYAEDVSGIELAETAVSFTNDEINTLWEESECWQRACSNFL